MRRHRLWGQPGWRLASGTLAHASPLLVDALAAAGLDLADLLDMATEQQTGMAGVLRVHPLRREGGSIQLMDAAGVLRRCEIQRRGDCLELSMSLHPRAFVVTDRDKAELSISTTLPETLRIAAKGRALGEMVDHPLLRRPDYVIRRVRRYSHADMIIIGFDAPMTVLDASTARRLARRADPL